MNTEKTKRLLDRVAIVAGAGSREGTSVLDVVGNDKNVAWAQRTRDLIESAPGQFSHGKDRTLVVSADVALPMECEAVVKAAVDKWGRVDILVNNVGIGGPAGTAIEVDPEQWKKAMDVNVLGMVLMSKFTIPEMLKTNHIDAGRGVGKAIINMSSVAGLLGGAPNLLYPTSKGAVINMTRAMAAHHGPTGIRVNAVAPGTLFTPMVAADGMPEQVRELRKNLGMLQIEGYGWDVGNAVVFLASDEARWITGIVLPVDAGIIAGHLPSHGGFSAPGETGKLTSSRGKL